jgi:hypothetical protein
MLDSLSPDLALGGGPYAILELVHGMTTQGERA